SLICGFSNKYIRVFDIRDFYRHQINIPTKATHGLCVDPFSDWCIAAYHECTMQLWDLRRCDKPLLIINESKPIVKLQWSPVKNSTLACLCRESDIVKVYHLQRVMSDDGELCYSDCYIQSYFPNASDEVLSFTWYPRKEYRLLLASSSNRFQDVSYHENCCLSWRDADLLISIDGTLTECIGNSCSAALSDDDDISMVMKRRAAKGYGLAIQHERHAKSDLFGNNTTLKWFWDWIDFVKDAIQENHDSSEFPGVIGILSSRDGLESKAQGVPLDPCDINFSSVTVKIYFSDQREKILQLCGWGNSWKNDRFASADPFLHSLCSKGEVERAAAIALFTGRLQLAVKILNKSASFAEQGRSLQLFALALSGFQNAANTTVTSVDKPDEPTASGGLWTEICAAMLPSIQNPHIKAMFYFLSCE
ncbi:unnamed protein product, partial [Soboliphyme baturini]|uniref:WD repeat-containing protein mio n=1 Tax=Soboliphyme baturini TaxID=241478 RepID=A0A183J761_9BILA